MPESTPPQPIQQPAQPQTVTVLGLGQMGLVCAANLVETASGVGGGSGNPNGGQRPSVRLWGHSTDDAVDVAQTRASPRLPGFLLPESVRVCLEIRDALAGADVIVSAIPVQFIRQAWAGLRDKVPAGAAILSVAKGIETGTLLRPTQIIAETLADDPDAKPRSIGTLSGPTIATELARCLPATMIAASDDPAFAARIQQLFSTAWLRIYTHDDLLGVELAGATKNVIAIAAGILDGLNAGNNAKSALLARGLAEIARLGAAMGAKPDTFFGIAGVGDLATTCFSPEGRNRSCGEALGRGITLADHLRDSPFVVEGVETTRGVVELARKYRVEMPITEAVHAVLFDGLDPITAIGQLMSRQLRDERVG